MGKQPVRRIEFDNKYEYAIFDDLGGALESNVSYPTREAAESSLRFSLDHSEGDPQRTYKILVRPTPKSWRALPPDSKGWTPLPTDVEPA